VCIILYSQSGRRVSSQAYKSRLLMAVWLVYYTHCIAQCTTCTPRRTIRYMSPLPAQPYILIGNEYCDEIYCYIKLCEWIILYDLYNIAPIDIMRNTKTTSRRGHRTTVLIVWELWGRRWLVGGWPKDTFTTADLGVLVLQMLLYV